MLILFAITHFSAILLLMVARLEIEAGVEGNWYEAWDEKEAQDYEEYIDAMFWAT